MYQKMERDSKHSLEIQFGKDTDTRGKQKRDRRERNKRETRKREKQKRSKRETEEENPTEWKM